MKFFNIMFYVFAIFFLGATNMMVQSENAQSVLDTIKNLPPIPNHKREAEKRSTLDD